VNLKYLAPHELSKLTFPRKPLIALRKCSDNSTVVDSEPSFFRTDRFTVLNRTWAAPGFPRALIEAIAKKDPDIYSRVGMAQEELIRKLFEELGAEVSSGKYKSRQLNLTGDCDAVIETDEAIVLIESKKVGFSMSAREGSVLDIVIDLAESLVKAQFQLAKQEVVLLTHGVLSASGKKINWEGRRIERIVVSLDDFGAIHSPTIARNVLQAFAGASFAASGELTADQKRRIRTLNKNCRQLGEIEMARSELDGEGQHPFWNAWFLPLSFVRYLCSMCGDVPEILEHLKPMRNVVTGQHEIFADLVATRNMMSKKPSSK
jgi:hypothetical protein